MNKATHASSPAQLQTLKRAHKHLYVSVDDDIRIKFKTVKNTEGTRNRTKKLNQEDENNHEYAPALRHTAKQSACTRSVTHIRHANKNTRTRRQKNAKQMYKQNAQNRTYLHCDTLQSRVRAIGPSPPPTPPLPSLCRLCESAISTAFAAAMSTPITPPAVVQVS
jgi:hypothetical protein